MAIHSFSRTDMIGLTPKRNPIMLPEQILEISQIPTHVTKEKPHGCINALFLNQGAPPVKGGTWTCRGLDPFLQASRCSLAYQFTINAPLICRQL